MTDVSHRYAHSGRAVGRSVIDEFIIVPVEDDVLQTHAIYSSNAIGARIWELIGEGHSLERVAEGLALDYDVAQETLQQDLLEFVSALEERGFITRVD